MQAAIWGMDHFITYLRGQKFTLVTNHQPLEKLGKVHTKSLNRLLEIMNSFNFDIIYKKGSKRPADYLSRNLVNIISWDASTLQKAQNADPLLKALKNFLLNKELPYNSKCQSLIKIFANDCFIEDDIVWRRIKRQFEPSRVVIFLPASLTQATPMVTSSLGMMASIKLKNAFSSATTGLVWMPILQTTSKRATDVNFIALMTARLLLYYLACHNLLNPTTTSTPTFSVP